MSELWQRRIGPVVDSLQKNGYETPRRAIELAAALGLRVDPGEWRRLGDQRGVVCRRRIMERLVGFGLANQQSEEWRFRHQTLLASIEVSARQRGVEAALDAIEEAEAELEQLDVPVRLGQCKGKKLRPLRQLGRFEETFEVLDEMHDSTRPTDATKSSASRRAAMATTISRR